MAEPWMLALGPVALAVALGLALFLPGNRRPPAPGAPRFAERYLPGILGSLGVIVAAVLLRLLQPFARPPELFDLGRDVGAVFAAADAGARVALAAAASPGLDAALAAVLLVVHPAMLLLAPLLWLAGDEERGAKGVLVGYAAFLVLALPVHFLLAVEVTQARPWPFLPEAGGLWFPPRETIAVPGMHTGLAVVVALAAQRSRNARFRPVAYAYPFAVALGVLSFGVNGLVGVLSGALFAGLADVLAGRATSVERIAHQRIDASPERKMEIRKAAEDLLFHLRWAAEARDLKGVEPRLVGSVAKDTYLQHKVDIDAFVLFPPDTPRRTLEEEGLALGRAVLEQPEERFAEHPYLAGKWKGLDAEVVPAFKVGSSAERMSAVDRTPFHTAYVLQQLEGLQRRDVRLLKQFLLGIGVYGAEAKVQGFSGYLAELLVLKYGSLRGVLEAGKDWRVGHLVALEPFEGVPRFPEPLVVIDPVDATRNVASALSLANMLLFQEAAREYLKDPRLSFFFPRAVVALPPARLAEVLRKRNHALLAVRFEKPDILDDSLHAQLRKCAGALGEALERSGFKVLAMDAHAGPRDASVTLELERMVLNEREIHHGPPVKAKEHAERFRAKWTGNDRALSAVYEEQGRLAVARRREFTNAAALVKAQAGDLDLGKDLSAVARAKGLQVLAQDEALKALDARWLTGFLLRARTWER